MSELDMNQSIGIARLEERMDALEKTVDGLVTSTTKLAETTAGIVGAMNVMRTFMYGILSVTVLAVLGMILERVLG